MPCFTQQPEDSWEEHLEKMLCYACRFLTKEEMLKFKNPGSWQGIFDWYSSHLLTDYHENKSIEEKERCQKEANRLGLKITEGKGFVGIEHL